MILDRELGRPPKPVVNVLSNTPATPGQIRYGLIAVAFYIVLVASLVPWAWIPGPVMPQVVSIFTTGIVVAELATAFLLVSQTIEERSVSGLLLGCAYLYSALFGIAHILTFPGAVFGTHPVLGTQQITGYIFNAWRVGFALLVLASVLASPRQGERGLGWSSIVGLALFTVALASVAGLLGGLLLEDSLPVFVSGRRFTLYDMIPGFAGVAIGLAAIVVLWSRRRATDILSIWLTLTLVAFCGDLLISTVGGGRYTLGWFVGRTSGFVSGCTLFVLFVLRFAWQQRDAADTAKALRERTELLRIEIARRSEAEERLMQETIRQRDQAKAELTRTNSLFQTVINMTPDLVFVKDLESRALLRNPAALFGKSWDHIEGRKEEEWHVSPEEAAQVVANDRKVIETGTSMQFEEHFTTSRGKRILLSTKSPLLDEHGKITGIIGVSTDITERESRARHVEFIMRELSHRSKNLLMILQSIARQTIRQSASLDDFEERFMARVGSLAKLHDLLVQEEWRGASVRAIAETQVRPFASDRLSIDGPDFFLKPDTAQVMSMIFHELATNASKYGALSNATGTVSIAWGLIDGGEERLFVRWQEMGGPAVTPPTRKGFGTVVLERTALQIPDASVALEFREDGVCWSLQAPAHPLLDAEA
jgi:PAS domain S-box-containing protein